jgi:hypothetical protein
MHNRDTAKLFNGKPTSRLLSELQALAHSLTKQVQSVVVSCRFVLKRLLYVQKSNCEFDINVRNNRQV